MRHLTIILERKTHIPSIDSGGDFKERIALHIIIDITSLPAGFRYSLQKTTFSLELLIQTKVIKQDLHGAVSAKVGHALLGQISRREIRPTIRGMAAIHIFY